MSDAQFVQFIETACATAIALVIVYLLLRGR
jgi:uncharacterized membrane protein YccC